jgi:hypothetical protein
LRCKNRPQKNLSMNGGDINACVDEISSASESNPMEQNCPMRNYASFMSSKPKSASVVLAAGSSAPPPAQKSGETFREKFCQRYGLAPDAFENEVLRRCLYPVGKLVFWLVGENPKYFSSDRDFIRGAGRARNPHEHRAEVWAFTGDPENRRFTRRYLKCRVSAGKVYLLMKALLEPGSPPEKLDTRSPLPTATDDFDERPSPAA